MGKKAWLLPMSLFGAAGLFVLTIALATPQPVRAADKADSGQLVGMKTCVQCHSDLAKPFERTPHAHTALTCEGCHGPGKAHVDGGGDKTKIRRFETLTPQQIDNVCLKCHEKDQQAHWVGSTHADRGLSCITCHDPHPKGPVMHKHLLKASEFNLCTKCHLQRKAQLYRSAHMPMLEGKIDCTSCHNPHGNSNPAMLLQPTVNQNCYTCHAEKRGPFLWEHPPVRENCTTCHDPHGSMFNNMLRQRVPILCQECHISSRHPSEPHTGLTKFAFNQGCLNCHPMIHGSNNPSGGMFQR